MINPISNALSGLMNASKKLDAAAGAIANAGTDGANVNLDQEMIKSLSASQEYQANAAVLARTAAMQKALGRVFDETV